MAKDGGGQLIVCGGVLGEIGSWGRLVVLYFIAVPVGILLRMLQQGGVVRRIGRENSVPRAGWQTRSFRAQGIELLAL